MKWTKKAKPNKKEERYVRDFAFFPVLLDDGHYIWLEFYWKIQFYYVPHIRGAGLKRWKTKSKYQSPYY